MIKILNTLDSPYKLSKEHALEFQRTYSEFFLSSPRIETLKTLLNKLNIELYEMKETSISGRYELLNSGYERIIVNASLPSETQLLIIMHELGHWYLRKNHPNINNTELLEWREAYANHFAIELSVPTVFREEIINKLYDAESVMDVLHLISNYKLKITPFHLFSVLYNERYAKRNDERLFHNIWILSKWKTNRFTNDDAKLRIISTFYNSEKYYVAQNQGLNRVIKSMDNFENLLTGVERKFITNASIKLKRKNLHPEFLKVEIECFCSVVRLSENKFDNLSTIITLLRFNLEQ